jgi:hypothetical protein
MFLSRMNEQFKIFNDLDVIQDIGILYIIHYKSI